MIELNSDIKFTIEELDESKVNLISFKLEEKLNGSVPKAVIRLTKTRKYVPEKLDELNFKFIYKTSPIKLKGFVYFKQVNNAELVLHIKFVDPKYEHIPVNEQYKGSLQKLIKKYYKGTALFEIPSNLALDEFNLINVSPKQYIDYHLLGYASNCLFVYRVSGLHVKSYDTKSKFKLGTKENAELLTSYDLDSSKRTLDPYYKPIEFDGIFYNNGLFYTKTHKLFIQNRNSNQVKANPKTSFTLDLKYYTPIEVGDKCTLLEEDEDRLIGFKDWTVFEKMLDYTEGTLSLKLYLGN